MEKEPGGEGANSVFDSLEVPQGEPLFDAVEKADRKTIQSLKKLGARAVQTVHQIAKSDRKTVQQMDAKVTKETLAQTRARTKKMTVVLGALFAVSLLLNLFSAFYTPGGALEFLFGHGARLYTFLHLLLFAGGVGVAQREVRTGMQDLLQKKWSFHATGFALDSCVLLHTLIMLAFGMDEVSGFVNFSLCALFLSLVEYAGRLVRLQTVQGDLAVMMRAGQLQGLCPVEDAGDAALLGRGLTEKPHPMIMVSADMPTIPDYDRLAMEYGLYMVYGENREALDRGETFPDGKTTRVECCRLLKTEALTHTLDGTWPRYRLNLKTGKYERDTNTEAYTGVIVGARADEEGSRSKERYFSPRDQHNDWDLDDQPPEFWNQFKTDFAPGTHVRIHPLLDWTELNVWEYIEREHIPTVSLYYNQGDGYRYRSLGCAPCTGPIRSESRNPREIIEELRTGALSNIAERSGRAQDAEDGGGLETLRRGGYM